MTRTKQSTWRSSPWTNSAGSAGMLVYSMSTSVRSSSAGKHYGYWCNISNRTEGEGRCTIVDSTVSIRASNNNIRITNVIFSHNFFDSFLALNDIKNRVDHEMGRLPSNFWAGDVANAVNGASEDDDSALQVILSEADPH